MLGGGPARGKCGHTRGEQERPAASGERVPDGLDRGPLGRGRAGRVRPVVPVGEVDDGLGLLSSVADAPAVVQVPAPRAGALRLQGCGGGIGPGQAGDLVALGKQFVDHGGADPSGGSGNEDAHG